MMPVFDITGVFKSMKTKSTVPMPANSEELRHRLQLMAASWVFVASQQTQNPFLKDVVDQAPVVFGHYADDLLGERVWKLTAKGPDGAEVAGPNWAMLLTYEYEIRCDAANRMMEDGTPLLKALREAWNDGTVKDLFFLTPLKLGGTKRSTPDTPGLPGAGLPGQGPGKRRRGGRRGQQQQQQQQQVQPGAGKGPGKGKPGKGKPGKGKAGKGKSKAPKGCAQRTPENKMICYAFNTRRGCQLAVCNFEHVCGVCFAAGKPMWDCTH